jgi:hypothetical protein
MGYGLEGQNSIPDRGEIFLFSKISRLTLGPTQPPVQWTQEALFPGVKRQKREADHSPPSSSEIKYYGATPPLPHTSTWHSV